MTALAAPAFSPRTLVPFVDLAPSHADLKEAIVDEIAVLIDDGAFTNGPQVERFERAFAAWCGTRHCVGLASGLDALRLALEATGIGPGDEVIAPAMTFVATVEAVQQAGARPVLVDVDERDDTISVEAAAAAIGSQTRALLPVHLYGQMADLRALRVLARDNGLALLEDACQAHGAVRDGLRAGAAGDASAFSFYPAKNLGAFGDAGAVLTGDAGLAERVRTLREHGQRRRHRHEIAGYTARLDTIQALVLLHKLPLLDGWNEQRRRAAEAYAARLDGVGDLRLPAVPAGSEPAWHLFVVRTARPHALARHLAGHGIESGRHYPTPVHAAPAFRGLGHELGEFPVAEALAREGLSLPLYPGITEEQLERVVDATEGYFADGRHAL